MQLILNTPRRASMDMLMRATRQKECDAEEARWEAQLRKMAKRESKHVEPIRAPRAVAVRSILKLVAEVTRHDALLLPRTLPLLTGADDRDLACGKCSDVIGARMTSASARSEYPEGERVIVRCTCGALNLLCHTLGARGGSRRRRPDRVGFAKIGCAPNNG